jgi:hypothetical protein
MPRIETWSHIPDAIRNHLIERMRDRNISLSDLNQLRIWMESSPNVPEGLWYKDFRLIQALPQRAVPENFSSAWTDSQAGSGFNRAGVLVPTPSIALYRLLRRYV